GLFADVEMADAGVSVQAPAVVGGGLDGRVEGEDRHRRRDVVAGRQILRDPEAREASGELAGAEVEAYPAAHIASTWFRCSGVNGGGSPPQEFSVGRPGVLVAVRTVLTRGSPAIHFRTAWAQVSTPSSASCRGAGRRSRIPPWSGLITKTPMCSSSARGRILRSASRRSGL